MTLFLFIKVQSYYPGGQVRFHGQIDICLLSLVVLINNVLLITTLKTYVTSKFLCPHNQYLLTFFPFLVYLTYQLVSDNNSSVTANYLWLIFFLASVQCSAGN